MNSVNLIGRLTRDPEVRYTAGENPMAIARFTIAIDRAGKKGEADFPNIVAFGKTAELVEKYVGKGRLVGITGRLQTGSYEKNDMKIYTTDVVADRVEFLDKAKEEATPTLEPSHNDFKSEAPEGFARLSEDDIPF